jgi:hypothetical protein
VRLGVSNYFLQLSEVFGFEGRKVLRFSETLGMRSFTDFYRKYSVNMYCILMNISEVHCTSHDSHTAFKLACVSKMIKCNRTLHSLNCRLVSYSSRFIRRPVSAICRLEIQIMITHQALSMSESWRSFSTPNTTCVKLYYT